MFWNWHTILGHWRTKANGWNSRTRKCQAPRWEAGRGPAWAEPLSPSLIEEKVPFARRGPCDEALSHSPHCTEATLLLYQTAWLCVLVWCQLPRTISSCSGEGRSFCKGEKLAQPTYVIVPLDSSRPFHACVVSSSIHHNASSEGLCAQKVQKLVTMGLFKITF